LIPFGAVDFDSSTDCGIQVERFVKDLGCRGLKLLPSYAHFFPNDAKMLPAYEAARDLGIPVMFHTGTSLFPGTRVRYADPLLLDDIADEFPDLSIIMSHGGRPFWYKEAEWMLGRHNNVHIDISGIPPHQLLTSFPKMDKFPDRFLFGSDWPNLPSVADQVRKILELPLKKTTVEGLLWGNGARMLGLD
jgi:predicted TIM-barrel fold metal-dependent hydrolase